MVRVYLATRTKPVQHCFYYPPPQAVIKPLSTFRKYFPHTPLPHCVAKATSVSASRLDELICLNLIRDDFSPVFIHVFTCACRIVQSQQTFSTADLYTPPKRAAAVVDYRNSIRVGPTLYFLYTLHSSPLSLSLSLSLSFFLALSPSLFVHTYIMYMYVDTITGIKVCTQTQLKDIRRHCRLVLKDTTHTHIQSTCR